MSTLEKAAELQRQIADEVVEDIDIKSYTLADAIREGASNSKQAYGWGNGETQCAMHSAVSSAIARGQM